MIGGSDDEEGIEVDSEFASMSRFEREQKQIKDKISKYEDFNVSDKPWQLIGGWHSQATLA